METEHLCIEKVGDDNGIAAIIMKYGKNHRNLLKQDFLKEISDTIHSVNHRYQPKVIILIGGGRVFSLGADLLEIDETSHETLSEFSRFGQEMMQSIRDIDPVVIAAVNGLAMGGGFELALACDVRWAHSRAVFAFPECLRGLIPAWSGTLMAKNNIPLGLAQELLMTGMHLGAQNAHKVGIVSRIFEGKNFYGDVLEAAADFVKIDKSILSGIKKLMNHDLSPSEQLRLENEVFASVGSKRPAGGHRPDMNDG